MRPSYKMLTGGEVGDFWKWAFVIINPYRCTAARQRVHVEPELNDTFCSRQGTGDAGLRAASESSAGPWAEALVAISKHSAGSKQLLSQQVCEPRRNFDVLSANNAKRTADDGFKPDTRETGQFIWSLPSSGSYFSLITPARSERFPESKNVPAQSRSY